MTQYPLHKTPFTRKRQVSRDAPKYKHIADLAGAAGKLPSPLSEQQMKQIVAEAWAASTDFDPFPDLTRKEPA